MTAEKAFVFFGMRQSRGSVEKSILPNNYVRRPQVVTHRLDRREKYNLI